MSARKAKRSRKARRAPKLIDVEGHKLTAEQYARYERQLTDRFETNPRASAVQRKQMALNDLLGPYRPSRKARGHLQDAGTGALALSHAIGTLATWPFFTTDAQVRRTGCEALDRIGHNLTLLGAKLDQIKRALMAEEGGKLQDWAYHEDLILMVGGAP